MAKIGINLGTGSLQKEEIIVGIDLGTTNSLIAIIHPTTKQAVALKEHDQRSLVPSVLYFNEDGSILVGDDATPFLKQDPANTIFSIKRLMGKSYKDIGTDAKYLGYKIIDNDADSLVKIQVGDKFYTPIELSSFILKALKERAEHILKTPVNKAVITVPAYFNDTQRQATRDAGKLAGLDVLRIINEPTAASLAYGISIQNTTSKNVAVYDLGGGTFDISILQLQDGVFEVLSTHGNTYLGGDDFDAIITKEFEKQLSNETIKNTPFLAEQLRILAKEAKQYLSSNDTYHTVYENNNLSITKTQFETLAQPLLQKTIESAQQALKDSKLMLEEIDEVILVGGSTRMPMVKYAVSKFFNKTANDTVNPDEVVALGAAWQADVLAGNSNNILLLDVIPLSLGIETMGGLMDVLIPRNTKIPTALARQYTTHIDGQSKMTITVYQGERDLVKDNRKLAEFVLENIPGMPAGLPKVEVAFKINADGILTVSAKELRSGVQQSIEVHTQYGLTDDTVETMLMDSLSNAKQDIATRALVEAKTEAEQIILVTQNFLVKHGLLINDEEKNNTNTAINNLQKLLVSEDKDAIHKQIEALNEISRPYAERVMDTAVSTALKGKIL
jgi:molecular chaperone HscA